MLRAQPVATHRPPWPVGHARGHDLQEVFCCSNTPPTPNLWVVRGARPVRSFFAAHVAHGSGVGGDVALGPRGTYGLPRFAWHIAIHRSLHDPRPTTLLRVWHDTMPMKWHISIHQPLLDPQPTTVLHVWCDTMPMKHPVRP